MKETPPTRRASQIAAALGALLVTASCAALSSEDQMNRGGLASRHDGGVGQLLRYCAKMRSAGNLVTAAGLCERAHRLEPANPEPLMALALILHEMGEPEGAAEAYRTILRATPSHVEARYALGKTYIGQKKYDLALNAFRVAVQHKPDDPRLYNALGVTNGLLGAHAYAQEAFRAGLAVAPKDVSLRNNLGLSLVLDGHYDQGLAILEAVARDPQANHTSHENLQLAQGLAKTAHMTALVPEPSTQAQAAVAIEVDNDSDDRPAVDSEGSRSENAETRRTGWTQAQAPETDRAEGMTASEPTVLTQSLGRYDEISRWADGRIVSESQSDEPRFDATSQRAEADPVADVDPSAEAEAEAAAPQPHTPAVMPKAAESTEDQPEARATAPGVVDEPAGRPAPERITPTPIQTARVPTPGVFPPESPSATVRDPLSVDADLETLANKPENPDKSAAPPAGGYAVQFASYRSEDRAWVGWEKLRAEADGLLDEVDPVVRQADLGAEMGTYYRLRSRPASRAESDRLCTQLRANGLDCLVVEVSSEVAGDGADDQAARM